MKLPVNSKTRLPFYIHGALMLMFFATWVVSIVTNIFWQGDYIAYYTAWKMVLNGDTLQLYNLASQRQYQEAILGPTQRFEDGLLPFVNPPHLMWPLVPLGLLPLLPSYLVWYLINLGLLVLAIRLLLTFVPTWSLEAKALLVVVVCGFYPVYITFLLGSFPLFMLVVLLLLFRDSTTNHPKRAGFWLLLATLKFQFILYIGLWLIATRRWRVIMWGLIYGIGLALITSLLLGWQVWGDYLRLLGPYSQNFDAYGVHATLPYTLKGTLANILGVTYFSQINLIAQIALIGVGIGLFWFFWRHPADNHQEAGWQYGLALLLNLLLSLHINHHDELLLVIPALFSLIWLQQRQRKTDSFVMFLLVCPTILFLSDITIGRHLGIQVGTILKIMLLYWMIKIYSAKTEVSAGKNQVLE